MADTGARPSAMDAARSMAHGEILARWARCQPDKAAFVYEGRVITYAEADRRANQVANALMSRGIKTGDRVALCMGNHIEHLEVLFGLFKLGAIAVPISFRLSGPEAAFVVDDSGATALVVDTDFVSLVPPIADRAPDLRFGLVNGSAVESHVPLERYAHAVDAAPDTPPAAAVSDHDPACIMYTSGTTGRPKGALLNHFNLLMNSVNSMHAQQIHGEDEVWYGVLPLFHIGALNGILLYLLVGGTSVVAPLGHFDAEQAIADLSRHKVTSCCFVQMQWAEICNHIGARRPALSLRRIVWGTSNAVIPLLEAMARTFPDVPIYNFFGQTEMSSVTCVLGPEDFRARIGSVGKPVINVEARIVDDDLKDVPQGETGEIVYRGPTVMQGYWGRPDFTEAAFAGGWFHSGDLCRADADGFIYVVDRKNDMIISGGENIYSAEVEAALVTHPAVAEAAVIGVPDSRWGETPMAVVVVGQGHQAPDLDDLTAHCSSRLASYKKPTRLAIVDSLPRNAAGKVTKHVLRQQFLSATSGQGRGR